ncbi:MAG: DUF2461 domain-containing protein [Gemmatimonadetes bacterium]|nr:DUF2461 domain-containing protein [Gemmatimonadota bacterium]
MAAYYSRETFGFLKDLKRNNTRAWFAENKSRYEDHLKDPSLRLIQDLAPALARISPHLLATPRALFRIHRDTRFSKDKSPYKTYLGLQFRHRSGRDAHAPGYYFHIEPGSVFVGAGIWHPDAPALREIREHIVEDPAAWKRASRAKSFAAAYSQQGDRLSRPPKGFDADHPLVEDLKWKDYIGVAEVEDAFALSPDLAPQLARTFSAATPFMRFLCDALGVPF